MVLCVMGTQTVEEHWFKFSEALGCAKASEQAQSFVWFSDWYFYSSSKLES